MRSRAVARSRDGMARPLFRMPCTATERFRQRLTVILPVPRFSQPGQHSGEVVWIAGLESIQKLPNWSSTGLSLVELYREFHAHATSILVLMVKQSLRPTGAASKRSRPRKGLSIWRSEAWMKRIRNQDSMISGDVSIVTASCHSSSKLVSRSSSTARSGRKKGSRSRVWSFYFFVTFQRCFRIASSSNRLI